MNLANWQKYSALAELLSSLAIVVTLIYLAIQTQQTNDTLLANSRQATMTADVEIVSALIGSPEAFTNMHETYENLSLLEQEQVMNAFAGLIRIREFAFFQYQNGILDENTLQSYLAPLARWLQWDSANAVWTIFREELDPEFVAYVDTLIDENDDF